MMKTDQKTDYDALNDEALAGLAESGDREAERRLIERTTPTIKRLARRYFLLGGETADLVQEGLIGLYSAIRDFRPERGASFRSFAEVCIGNRIRAAIKRSACKKHGPLNGYISLDMPLGDGAGESETLADRLEGGAGENPEALAIWREDERSLVKALREKLTEFEKTALALYLNGCSYKEIGEKTGRTAKAADNAMQRVKKKVAALVKQRETDED